AMLEQVFINALKNAIEASDDEGLVTIRTFADPVRLTICNTGQIITPEIQQKLFTPFYSTKPTGQGIGLMLIREILTRHNFQFSLETINGVTEFKVCFG
ncbi:MAG: PAS domain-containing sensor histidine kinase, partial [Bacteroidetes bacterium HGW-Bacteroidetes-22]